MARGRMLNKKISKSIQFNGLPDDTCRLLATWIIAHLDKNGVFTAEPVLVKAEILPWRSDITYEQVEYYLEAMETAGLIVRFKAKGQCWQWWPGFVENQTGLRQDRETTDCPEPPEFELPPEPGTMPAASQKEPGTTPYINEDNDGINPETFRNDAGMIPEDIRPKLSLNKDNITTNVVAAKAAPTAKKTKKPGEEAPDLKKQLMGAFCETTGLVLPHNKPDQGFWWSQITEILHIAGGDADAGKVLIKNAVGTMRRDNLTITGPQSIAGICRALVAERSNGHGPPKPQYTPEQLAHIKEMQREVADAGKRIDTS